jgi:two-component system sensor kinase
MGALIDDILKLSRAGREEIRLERVDMGALARDAFEEARAADPERRVTFRLGELPEAFGDHTLLRQVWSNLIGNAVKFTAHQSEAVVAVAGAVEGHELVYLVRDNGIGFDMRQAERIFGVFERLHGPQDFEGTGIGLAIVKRIVERHGGRVWAEGTPGEGATFTFTLPRRPTGALDGAPAEA